MILLDWTPGFMTMAGARVNFKDTCISNTCIMLRGNSFECSILSNNLSESIHIWNIQACKGPQKFHKSGPFGSCPKMGLGFKSRTAMLSFSKGSNLGKL